jgi:hypothetical protein
MNHKEIERLRAEAFKLPPAEQYRLATFIAENVGYELTSDQLRGGPAQGTTTCDWDDADYTKARDCMRSILLPLGPTALWTENFDNAFQHAVGMLSLSARVHAERSPSISERVETLLSQIGGKNDLSKVGDDPEDLASAAFNALYECELLAREALELVCSSPAASASEVYVICPDCKRGFAHSLSQPDIASKPDRCPSCGGDDTIGHASGCAR